MEIQATHFLPDLLRTELTRQVQRVLQVQAAEVLESACMRLNGGFEADSGVYLLAGNALVGNWVAPWSVVLKEVRATLYNQDPHGIQYWKREALLYKSGVLADLPGGLSAPKCYEVVETTSKTRLWLEYLEDASPNEWKPETYLSVARRLGRFNGAYLANRSIPNLSFLATNWLSKYVERAAPSISFIRQNPRHPLVQQVLANANLHTLLAWWEERGKLLKILDSMPQTFCHQDAFCRNLFVSDQQTCAFDWSYCGPAPLGAELAPLVFASLGFSGKDLSLEEITGLDHLVFGSYLEGLREAGWQGSLHQVRLAYSLTLALRYVFGALFGEVFPYLRSGDAEKLDVNSTTPILFQYISSEMIESLRLLGLHHLFGMASRTAWRMAWKRI